MKKNEHTITRPSPPLIFLIPRYTLLFTPLRVPILPLRKPILNPASLLWIRHIGPVIVFFRGTTGGLVGFGTGAVATAEFGLGFGFVGVLVTVRHFELGFLGGSLL